MLDNPRLSGSMRLLAVSDDTMLALSRCSGQGGSDNGGSTSSPATSPTSPAQPGGEEGRYGT